MRERSDVLVQMFSGPTIEITTDSKNLNTGSSARFHLNG